MAAELVVATVDELVVGEGDPDSVADVVELEDATSVAR